MDTRKTHVKCLDRADTIIALELEACPYYGCEVKGLEDARVRYEEETIPIPPLEICPEFGGEYKRIKRKMRESRICNYDDTEQRVDGMNRCPWAFVSKEMVLYLTNKNRGGKKVVIKVLGGDYEGVRGQDSYISFDGTPGKKQGVCRIRRKAAEFHELFTFMSDENPEKRLLYPRKRIYPQQIKLKRVTRLLLYNFQSGLNILYFLLYNLNLRL